MWFPWHFPAWLWDRELQQTASTSTKPLFIQDAWETAKTLADLSFLSQRLKLKTRYEEKFLKMVELGTRDPGIGPERISLLTD